MDREQIDKVLDLTKDQVERKFGKGSLMRLGEQANIGSMPAIPTGSLALDAALGADGSSRSTDPNPAARPRSRCRSSPRPSGSAV
jgi:RecA/RadA recombinase